MVIRPGGVERLITAVEAQFQARIQNADTEPRAEVRLATEGAQGDLALPAVMDFTRRVLTTTAPGSGKLTLAANLTQGGDPTVLFEELIKTACEQGFKLEMVLDDASYGVMARKLGRSESGVHIRKLQNRELTSGIRVIQTADPSFAPLVPIALDQAEAADSLHEMFQGLSFDAQGMDPGDPNTPFLSQTLFAALLIKAAQLAQASGFQAELERRLRGVTDPLERTKIRAALLKNTLLRALQDAGYLVSDRALQTGKFGLMTLAGSVLLQDILADFRARAEIRRAA